MRRLMYVAEAVANVVGAGVQGCRGAGADRHLQHRRCLGRTSRSGAGWSSPWSHLAEATCFGGFSTLARQVELATGPQPSEQTAEAVSHARPLPLSSLGRGTTAPPLHVVPQRLR
jgi:hypothetical protein